MINRLCRICVCFLFIIDSAFGCTRILWQPNSNLVLVGRTMDWTADTESNLWVFPRGLSEESPTNRGLRWISRYGSVTADVYGIMAIDGMNEKGLAGHLLWLDSTDYGKPDAKINSLTMKLWLRYYLDNFSSVDEAIKVTQTHPFYVIPYYFKPSHTWVKLHLALEDASGDSAIIEYVQGKLHIYHHHQYRVLTNTPSFPLQLKNLARYQENNMPSGNNAKDRFVRASFGVANLPETTSLQQAIMMLTSVMHNVAEPFMAKADESDATYWTAIADLTNRVYYFQPETTGSRFSIDLKKMDLKPGSPVLKLDTKQPDLVGDVTTRLKPV